jgi:hypothetical protein
MTKQSYYLTDKIKTKLLQLEWIKKELKLISYELNKF